MNTNMLKTITSVRALMFAAIVALGFSVTGCDLGNKSNDTNNSGTKEGVIQEGDRHDESNEAEVDTAELDSFK